MKKSLLSILIATVCLLGVPTVVMASQMLELIEVEQIQPTLNISGGTLRVSGANDQVLQIYNIAGVCIFTAKIDSNDKTFDLKDFAKGCYIIKVGKITRKVSIK